MEGIQYWTLSIWTFRAFLVKLILSISQILQTIFSSNNSQDQLMKHPLNQANVPTTMQPPPQTQQQPFSVPRPPCKPAPPPPSSNPGFNNILFLKFQTFLFNFSRVCTKTRTWLCSETSSESVSQGNILYKWRIICNVINLHQHNTCPPLFIIVVAIFQPSLIWKSHLENLHEYIHIFNKFGWDLVVILPGQL